MTGDPGRPEDGRPPGGEATDRPGVDEAGAPWRSGPLPVRQLPVPGRVGGSAADRDTRLGYFETRVAEALYGLPDRPVRWHRRLRADLAGGVVTGVELLRLPLSEPKVGLAVLHVLLPTEPEQAVATLERLARIAVQTDDADGRPALGVLLPSGTVVHPGRAQTITHVSFVGEPPAAMPEAYAAWPAHRQWLWLAASATSVRVFPPDPEDAALFDGLVRFSADWQALVLRDGAAFVGLRPDPGGDDTFHAMAESHVHSVYLDAFLLGKMQLAALNELANRVARTRPDRIGARTLVDLEYQLMEIRRSLWARHVTVRGKGNELLERYQQQHRLPDLLSHIVSNLADASRLVEAATARSVNAALGVITVVGLPFGLTYAGGALWGRQSPGVYLVCTVIAVVLAAILLLAVPPVRRMVGALRPGPLG